MRDAAPMLERLLDGVLRDADRADALTTERALRDLCAPDETGGFGDLDKVAERLRDMDAGEILTIIGLLTMRFHLRNKAEQLTIASINRDRERKASADRPRAESIDEAVAILKNRGLSAEALRATLARIDVRPTLTAHPTEARRRAVLRKQARLAELCHERGDARLTPAELDRVDDGLKRTLIGLATTDEVRSERLGPADEIRNGLHFVTGSIWRTAPRLYDDLRRAVRARFDEDPVDPPALLRYRSWIGGDRDGNPRVTPEVTEGAFATHAQEAVRLYITELEALFQKLTVSTRRRPASDELLDAIQRDTPTPGFDEREARRLRYEPYRARVIQLMHKVRGVAQGAGYTAREFEADIEVMRRSLRDSGLGRMADSGALWDLAVRVRTFGFHLAALDVRQHSDVHAAAVAEVLASAGVTDRYAEMDEAEKLEILRAELATPRPLTPKPVVGQAAAFGDATESVLGAFRVVADAIRRSPESFGSYVISMTHDVSDVLETLLLAKEAGLYRPPAGGAEGVSLIDVAPLFETSTSSWTRTPLCHTVIVASATFFPLASYLASRNSMS